MSGSHISAAASLQQQVSGHKSKLEQAMRRASTEAAESARAHAELTEAETQLSDMAGQLTEAQYVFYVQAFVKLSRYDAPVFTLFCPHLAFSLF
jgi:vacuolar-type H+-ATPase subunit I/STV1